MILKDNFDKSGKYLDNTDYEKFVLYKLIYPIVNRLGLNRRFNLLRHNLGLYSEFSDNRCKWCGEKHREKVIPTHRIE
jgi:hypothetical protein